MDLAEAGGRYLLAGLSILAIQGKRPHAVHRHWKEDAFRGEDAIPRWMQICTDPDTSGVAIAIPWPLCVVDVDGEAGAKTFRSLVGKVPDWGAVAKTGRGLHLWYCSPQEVRNGVLAEKLDIKSVGGYVIAPPSRHYDEDAKAFTGRTYEWVSPLIGQDGEILVDFLPEPIEEMLAVRRQFFDATPQVRMASGGSIDGLAAHVRRASAGTRNGTLNWSAWTARQDGIPFAEALSALTEAAVAAGLGKREAMRTIRSAYEGGKP